MNLNHLIWRGITMDGISNVTMKVIEKLGYLNSDNFYYYQDLLTCSELSFHDRKVIMEIRPNAFFSCRWKA